MRLGDLDALKDNMFHYAAPEMVWDRGDIEHKINEMPTIDAIPVEWLRDMMLECEAEESRAAWVVMREWRKWKQEQEAHQ